MKLAALDVGSNSIHLLIARIHPDHSYEIIYKDKAMVRLGSRAFRQGLLSAVSMKRAMVALTRYAQVIDKFEVTEVIATATSAVREASNGTAFLKEVKRATGLKVDRISGPEEARLVAVAVGALPPFERGRHLVIDIGGGSTEIAVLDDQEPRGMQSFKLGCVRLAEELPLRGRTGRKALKELRKRTRDRMGPLLRGLSGTAFETIVGTSGTIVSLGLLAMRRTGGPVVRGRTFQVSRPALNRELVHLAGLPLPERKEYMGDQAGRADVILHGGAILAEILESLPNDDIHIPDRSIRDGMILDFIRGRIETTPGDHARRLVTLAGNRSDDRYDPHTVREQAVLSLARRYHYEPEHAHQVTRLSAQLFDLTTRLHGCGPEEKFYLEAAAVLHDIGQHIAYSQHHKHSLYLIMNSGLTGFHDREIQLIGNIARYHRKALPGPAHPEYMVLSSDDRRLVDCMAALLRIADALDYGHLNSAGPLGLELSARKAVVKVTGLSPTGPEIRLAGAKSDLFRRAFRRAVTFKALRSRSNGSSRGIPQKN